jgi:hypothetical protein
MDDESGGPSYLVSSWVDTCEWMGRSNLTLIYLSIAIGRFYLALGQGESAFGVDDPAPAIPDE